MSDDFDANRLLLSHGTEEPCSRWETAALLRLVSESIDGGRRGLSRRRTIMLTSALARLGERGIGADMVLRTWMGPRLVSLALLMASYQWHECRVRGRRPDAALAPWVEILDGRLGTDTDRGLHGAVLEADDALKALAERWRRSAAVAHLVDFRVSGYLSTDVDRSDLVLAAGEGATVWLFERLTLTYLDQWSSASLQWELAYIDQPSEVVRVLGVDDGILAERRVPLGGIAGEISRRLLANGVAGEPVDGLSTQEVSQEVIRFLRLGDHGGALDLATRAFLKSPRDDEVALALACCLMVSAPEQARDLLEQLQVRAMLGGSGADSLGEVVCIDLATLGLADRTLSWDQAVERVRGVRTQGWFWDPVDCVQGVWTFREMTADAWVNRVRELCE